MPVLNVDPRWLGVPYIPIPHTGIPKFRVENWMQGGDVELSWRSTRQDVPTGIMTVKVDFPRYMASALRERFSKNAPGEEMSVLVLRRNWDDFMEVLHIHDLCFYRNLPDERSRRRTGTRYVVELPHGAPKVKAHQERLLEWFHKYPLSSCLVVRKQREVLEKPDTYGRIRRRELTNWDVATQLSWLKNRGDIFLQSGHYQNAWLCYNWSILLEFIFTNSSVKRYRRTFWHPHDHFHIALQLSTMVNMATAIVYGEIDISVFGYCEKNPLDAAFMIYRSYENDQDVISVDNFMSMMFILCILSVFSEPRLFQPNPGQVFNGLEMIIETWENFSHRPSQNRRQRDFLQTIYNDAKRTADVLGTDTEDNRFGNDQLRRLCIQDLKQTLKANPPFLPFKWIVLERNLWPREIVPRVREAFRKGQLPEQFRYGHFRMSNYGARSTQPKCFV